MSLNSILRVAGKEIRLVNKENPASQLPDKFIHVSTLSLSDRITFAVCIRAVAIVVRGTYPVLIFHPKLCALLFGPLPVNTHWWEQLLSMFNMKQTNRCNSQYVEVEFVTGGRDETPIGYVMRAIHVLLWAYEINNTGKLRGLENIHMLYRDRRGIIYELRLKSESSATHLLQSLLWHANHFARFLSDAEGLSEAELRERARSEQYKDDYDYLSWDFRQYIRFEPRRYAQCRQLSMYLGDSPFDARCGGAAGSSCRAWRACIRGMRFPLK